MITIAHLSDPHLDGGDRATERAAAVVDYLRAVPGPVDVVLVTGDIADHGKPDEYEQARQLFARLPHEVLVLPGNHDVRGSFTAGLLDGGHSDAPVNRAVSVAGASFLLCDSTVPGRDDGLLADETIGWIDSEAARAPAGQPVFVCFHHPPVELHAPHVDPIRQFGEDRLEAVLHRHPAVVAVLCGHAHTAAVTTFAGRPLCVGPGIASTVRLAVEGAPTVDFDLPPVIAFHVLDDAGRLTTHFRVVVP